VAVRRRKRSAGRRDAAPELLGPTTSPTHVLQTPLYKLGVPRRSGGPAALRGRCEAWIGGDSVFCYTRLCSSAAQMAGALGGRWVPAAIGGVGDGCSRSLAPSTKGSLEGNTLSALPPTKHARAQRCASLSRASAPAAALRHMGQDAPGSEAGPAPGARDGRGRAGWPPGRMRRKGCGRPRRRPGPCSTNPRGRPPTPYPYPHPHPHPHPPLTRPHPRRLPPGALADAAALAVESVPQRRRLSHHRAR
jgi:hypothetical protein